MGTKEIKPFIAEKASEDRAYSERTDLTEVVIPASVTEIGFCAFDGCSGLTSVVIPASVERIEVGAFDGCSGLTSVEIPADAEIEEGAFPSGVCIRRKKTDWTD